MSFFAKLVVCLLALSWLSGCVAVAVVGTAVGVTTTVVGGAVDVVDAVTPDIISDDEDEDEDEDE